MRIAFICKRHYTGKDVINDCYGRLYEIPHQLALLGHDVKAWCFDYYGTECKQLDSNANPGELHWFSYAVKGMGLLRLPVYLTKLINVLKTFEPDIIIGASDIPHVVLASYISKKQKTPCVIDLYDNFYSFGQARIPGFKYLLKRSIKKANLIVTVSNNLKEKTIKDFDPECLIHVMSNGINKNCFFLGNRENARSKLGLPLHSKLIGTAGGLSRMKGVDTLYDAWLELKTKHPDLHLVLAGPIEASLPIPNDERVHYLGVLPEKDMVSLFQALDVGVVTLQNSEFGRYCFPQKAYEMLACALPVVAANVGIMSNLLSKEPELLYTANDPQSLVSVIDLQLKNQILPDIDSMSWHDLVFEIESLLNDLILSS